MIKKETTNIEHTAVTTLNLNFIRKNRIGTLKLYIRAYFYFEKTIVLNSHNNFDDFINPEKYSESFFAVQSD